MRVTNWFLNFDFGGRARRSHYWANLGAWLAVVVAIILLSSIVKPEEGEATSAVGGVIALAAMAALVLAAIDGVAMVFRRAHDTGKSGWVWLLLLIPIINLLPFYWLMIEDSHQGPNKYGPPVKQFYDPAAATAGR